MALSLMIKLINVFSVVHFFRVDLIVTQDYALPNNFGALLKVDVQELTIFDGPEAVVDSHFLVELAINDRLCLSLHLHLEMLGLDHDEQVSRFGALGDWDLNIDIFG